MAAISDVTQMLGLNSSQYTRPGTCIIASSRLALGCKIVQGLVEERFGFEYI